MLDKDGALHEVVAYYGPGDNPFREVETESLVRGIQYADTISVKFPFGR